ncbi:hypothetical protein ACWDXV_32570 [Nocardia nova]
MVAELIAHGGPVGAVLLDLDGSGIVRARGLAHKVALVQQVQAMIRARAPHDAIVIDSGSRDEVYIVAGGDAALGMWNLAEELRAAVAAAEFRTGPGTDPVSLTTSVGYTMQTAPSGPHEVFRRVRDGLYLAKKERNCVRDAAAAASRRMKICTNSSVLERITEVQGNLDEIVHMGMWILAEKHGPMRYWVGRQGTGKTSAFDIPQDVPATAVRMFKYLLSSIAFESAVAARLASGGGSVSVHRTKPSARPEDIVAQYLPDVWVRFHPGDPSIAASDIFIEVQRSRGLDGDEVAEIETVLGAHETAALTGLADSTGRRSDLLLTEALHIGLEHADMWTQAAADRGQP